MRLNYPRNKISILNLCVIFLFFLLSITGCNNTKYLKPGQKLYTGADVKLKSDKKKNENKSVEAAIVTGLRPIPNKSFMGIFRPRLWYYNIAGSPKKSYGLRYWLKTQVGEPPVLFDPDLPEHTSRLIEGELENKGFFDPDVTYELEEKRKKVSVIYTAKVNKQYVIKEIKLPADTDSISAKVGRAMVNTTLAVGDAYDLDRLKQERIRIDEELKKDGYFFFNPDYLLFQADSTVGNNEIKLEVVVKKDIPVQAKTQYKINEIYVLTTYSVTDEYAAFKGDTIMVEDIHYIKSEDTFKPHIITRSIDIKKGTVYSRDDHDRTLRKLTDLGVFKFVNLRFYEADSALSGKLNCYISLIPLEKKSLRLELQAISKSNNFAGPGVIASFRNRNTFKGAELFVFNINTSFESQFRNRNKNNVYSYELSLDQGLFIPRFITPFKINESDLFVPTTKFTTGVRSLSRINYFNLNSVNMRYGYNWKETLYKEHDLNILAIDYLQLSNTTTRFNELLNKNLLLRKSFSEQFTFGSTYSYILNTRLNPEKQQQVYWITTADLSGNSLYLLGLQSKKNGNSNSYFGVPFSQYSRFDTDFRYYFNFNKSVQLATRFIAGIGVPYGNSDRLPYIKQFFSGGSSSVRAFAPRSLGPGSLRPSEDETLSSIEQGGEMKLENSIELRFDIFSMFKGALFTDIGNVWLVKKDPTLPGAEFNPGTFLNQLAVGSGAGLRVDASFLVLRFDLAFPLVTPYDDEAIDLKNDTDQSLFGNNNFTLNVAIGYPF